MFQLADRLHKTVDEISELPFEELQGWLGYFRFIRNQQNKGK